MPRKVRKAVFPVAGMGTRVLPATKAMPKEMLTVVDKPIIQYAVEEAMAAGIEEFIFVTGHGKSAIENHFDRAAELERALEERGKMAELKILRESLPPEGSVFYTRQRAPLGLGHAVWCAKGFVGNEPFAVLLPDDIIVSHKGNALKDMIALYEETGTSVTLVTDVPREHTRRYGILEPAGDATGQAVKAKNFVEKPDPKDAPSTLANVGRYVLSPRIFDFLDEKKAGAGGEIQLTDAMVELMHEEDFYAWRLHGERFDCGDKAGLVIANMAMALRRDDLRTQLMPALEALLESAQKGEKKCA
ncbi:MAG: UTP--glucose-1-phosphate uridylyltransferase GalU [Proteobacteria bacterium]|nr:UTP--glucose-1-phosphate uridylyltransferase GalU [Pseudomonadota bacterium]